MPLRNVPRPGSVDPIPIPTSGRFRARQTGASGGTIVATATLPSSHAISAAPTASSNISRRRRQPLERCFASGAVASAWLHAWPRYWNSAPMASRWTAHWCARLGVPPPTLVCCSNSRKAASFPRTTGYRCRRPIPSPDLRQRRRRHMKSLDWPRRSLVSSSPISGQTGKEPSASWSSVTPARALC